jgi:hypothetical protein
MPVSFEYRSASCWNGLSVAPLALPKVKVKLSAASPELLSCRRRRRHRGRA